MADEQEDKVVKITQTVAGTIIFLAMFWVYIFVKEFQVLLFAFPGLLLGIDLSKLLGVKK